MTAYDAAFLAEVAAALEALGTRLEAQEARLAKLETMLREADAWNEQFEKEDIAKARYRG